jgi:hypothetical protein
MNSRPLVVSLVILTIALASLSFYEASTTRTPPTAMVNSTSSTYDPVASSSSSTYSLDCSTSNVIYGPACDSLNVEFQMTANIVSNGSILFAGVISNTGIDPAISMRIMANGTDLGLNDTYWTTTYSPYVPTLGGQPLEPGNSVTFHSRLMGGATCCTVSFVPCQSFRCLVGDKLLIEVDLFGNNTNSNFAGLDSYITIGSG